jgi:hypothetical protein
VHDRFAHSNIQARKEGTVLFPQIYRSWGMPPFQKEKLLIYGSIPILTMDLR